MSEPVKNTAAPEPEPEVLPQDPPPQILRWLGWLIIAIFTVTLLASIFVRVPESVQCAFELVAEGGTQAVLSPQGGEIQSVKIRAGQEVAASEALFVILGKGGSSATIAAPCAGVVTSLKARPGKTFSTGDELCELARLDGRLLARLSLPEAAVPLLKAGQRVQFFFAAFPYQRFGTGGGHLTFVSAAPTGTGEAQGFTAEASVEHPAFMVEGRPVPLRLGMRGEARVVLGERTLIEHAFEPLRQLREQSGK